MKKILISTAVAAMMLASCTNESLVNQKADGRMFTLKVSQGMDSRTTLTPVAEGFQTLWSEGDQIYVTSEDGKTTGVLTLDPQDKGKPSGTFTGYIFGNGTLKNAIFPVPIDGVVNLSNVNVGEIDAPMAGTITGNGVTLANKSAIIRLNIIDLPANSTLTITGSNLHSSAKWDGAKFADGQAGEITITGAKANKDIYVPVFVKDNANNTDLTVGVVNGSSVNLNNIPVAVNAVSMNVPAMIYTHADEVEVVEGGETTATGETVVNKENFAESLTNNTTEEVKVLLSEDISYNGDINTNASINLNGNTFEAGGTIELGNNSNLTMIGGDYEVNDAYGHVDVRPSSEEGSVLYYEDVNFSYNKLNKTYGPSTNRLGSVVEVCATVGGAYTKITFKRCTFNNAQVLFEGMSGKTGTFEATFEECTFNALTSSAPVYVQNYVEGSIELKNCTFNLECTSSSASAVSVSPNTSTKVVVTATSNTINAVAATPYTYDASKGEDETHNVKVNGTPANIKFISCGENCIIVETGTVKTGIAAK